MMKKLIVMIGAVVFFASSTWAQSGAGKEKKTVSTPGILTTQELKQLVPPTVFFQGQTAPVQLRNSGGVRGRNGRLMLVAMVDSSGYSTGVAQKYQAYLLTEGSLAFQGKVLAPGAYGVGFLDNNTFNVMDLGANDIAVVPTQTDAALRRAVPLKIVTAGEDSFRLYFGKHYVEFTFQK
jgi:hypothetical protein